jgi:hypothetical protein
MKLCSEEAQQILKKGGRLRKSYWRKDDWMILHGVWFFRTTNIFTSKYSERLILNGIKYMLYSISSDSIYESDFIEVEVKNNAGFGLEF